VSRLLRHLGSLIEVSRSGREVQFRWSTRRRRTTRQDVLGRAVAVFVLCPSLLVACGDGGGDDDGGGGGGTTTATTIGPTTTTTTGTTTTTTTTP
jgi:hypothetical protein